MTYEEAESALDIVMTALGNLFWHSPRKFISWIKPSSKPEKSRVSLFGDFTADELEAIAVFMRGKK